MFLFRFSFGTVAVLLATLALALLGLVTAGAAVVGWAAAAVTLLGLMMVADQARAMRGTGAAILGVVFLGVALFAHLTPAHASAAVDLSGALITRPVPAVATIAAPPGDDGFWSGLNGYLAEGVAALVATFAGWALKEIAVHTRIKIRADQEAQIRETLKTGAFAAMGELELQVDRIWTPAQRQALITKAVDWAQDRAAAQLKKLGLPGFVVNAMASKVVGEVLAAYPFILTSPDAPAGAGQPGTR